MLMKRKKVFNLQKKYHYLGKNLKMLLFDFSAEVFSFFYFIAFYFYLPASAFWLLKNKQ